MKMDNLNKPGPIQPPPQGKKMATDRDPLINSSPEEAESGFFERLIRPCAAEFIGVTLFVFIGTASVFTTSGNIVGIALAHGLCIALLVAALGAISGAHLNPAVTLGILCAGGIGLIQAIGFLVSQMMGGLLGAALFRGIVPTNNYTQYNGGAHLIPEGIHVSEALLCEVMLTALLVMVVLLAAVDSGTKNVTFPFAIGVTVTVDILAGGNVSGASMNPARSFGPAVAVSTFKENVWTDHWIYWLGPALGAVLAALIYRLILASPGKRFNSSSR